MNAAHTGTHLGRSASRHQLLRIHPAQKSDAALELRGKVLSFHPARQRLQRMQAVYSGINDAVDYLAHAAAGMQRNLVAVPVSLLHESPHTWKHKLLKHPRAADQTGLAAQVVAKEEAIHQVARNREESLIRFVVKPANLIRNRMHQFRTGAHLHEVLFHSEQIGNVMVVAGPE